MPSSPKSLLRRYSVFIAAPALFSLSIAAHAQSGSQSGSQSSSSSSSSNSGASTEPIAKEPAPAPQARIAQQPEAGGSAITLETSEPLFYIAAALNTCGYDTDLSNSAPVRRRIREEISAEIAAAPEARDAAEKLCGYIREHTLNDSGLNLAQYISLSLYLSPPPELTPTADEASLPPDSTQVINVLPLLRTFAEAVHLQAIWSEHRSEYDDLVKRVHDPLTKTILNTNIYLRMPVSSYDGRRFLVLLEPMLAPAATNARIYANDYIIVASPAAEPLGAVHMDDIRHTYLHFLIEPLVYSRASAMDRLQPLLKAVQAAPLDYTYKTAIVPLITECLIKAVEAHTMDVGAPPKKPTAVKQRAEIEQYNADLSAYEHHSEETRRTAIDLDMRQGWILAEYFYNQLAQLQKDNVGLRDGMGEMVYGMDVDRERHRALQIAFLPNTSHDVLRRAPVQPTGLQLAEMEIFKGNLDGASAIANKVLADPAGDHAQAHYILARVNLMQRQPGAAIGDFQQVLSTSKDPRTLAWSHIYLGRLYDVMTDRTKAVAEYHAALSVPDVQPDTRVAAEQGLKTPFTAPTIEHTAPATDDDDAPLDPSGKAEKDAYKPPPPPNN